MHEQEQHGQEQQAPWASTWSGQIAVSAARGGGRSAQHLCAECASKILLFFCKFQVYVSKAITWQELGPRASSSLNALANDVNASDDRQMGRLL